MLKEAVVVVAWPPNTGDVIPWGPFRNQRVSDNLTSPKVLTMGVCRRSIGEIIDGKTWVGESKTAVNYLHNRQQVFFRQWNTR